MWYFLAMEEKDSTLELGFRGTQVRDDGTGPMLISHRQHLFVVSGPDSGLEKTFEQSTLRIGTADDNDFLLTDRTVSRYHAEIAVRADRYYIRDLESTNGTSVNGTPVVEAILAPGARVRFGDTEVIFEPKKTWERVESDNDPMFGEMLGSSVAMREAFAMLRRVAKTELSCVLIGETGTGKELAARGVHDHSVRRNAPFVVVDCGSVSETLLGAELFGHEKGAFTGADRKRVGAFETADKGTVFLDEIGELPLELQPKLLRVLERREIKRLGAPRHVSVDVRVVAATHRDLRKMVKDGTFRDDLYYRLAEVVVSLPPLRERPGEIPVLSKAVVEKESNGAMRLDESALSLLQSYRWPGNVRELRNVLRRAMALCSNSVIRAEDLQLGSNPSINARSEPVVQPSSSDVGEELPLKEARDRWVSDLEREYLIRLLRRHGGDLTSAAESAAVHRKSLERLLRQHGIKASDWS